MPDIKLLVADDEPVARAFIRKIVENERAPVAELYEAGNGLEAVELARLHTPDLALLDIRMPGLDGLKTASAILEASPGTRIVIITAHDDFDYARSALRAGVEDYLLKPVRPEDVLDKIAGVFREQPSRPGDDRELPTAVRGAVEHVRANLGAPLDLPGIAAAVFLSPFHLSRLFARHMGKPLSDFIQDERLAAAKDLLVRTSDPISAIAERTGFSSLAYFSACFKKKLGLSPSQYRKKFGS